MVSVVLLIAVAWMFLALLGAVVLTSVAPAARQALLPAAPLVGAAFLVVSLHATGLVLPVRWGLPVAGLVALALLVVGLRRGTARPFADRASLLWSLGGLLVAVPFTVIAAAPSLRLDDPGVISPASSNDAVWYVSVSRWLQDHSILDVPSIAAAPTASVEGVPADGPAVSALVFPLRLGQELVQASLNTVTGSSALDTFSPWLAAWVLLIPGGCIAAAHLLGIGRRTGLAAGIAVAASALVVQQVYAQNAASVLAIAMVMPVLACVVAAVERRFPLLLAALMLSALVGTYTEYAPFVGPALVGAVLLRRHGLRDAVVRGAGVVALAIVIAPLVWWRALGTFLGVRGGAADAWPTPFVVGTPRVTINRLVGAGPLSGGFEPSLVALALAAAVLAGMGLAVLLGPQRGMWIGLLAIGVPFLAYLSIENLGYTQRRAVEIAVPLALFMSVAGWGALVRFLAARTRRAGAADERPARLPRVPLLTTAGLLAVLLVWSGVNVRSSLASDDSVDLPNRHVDDAYAAALGWVQEYGGPEGEAVSVLAPDFFAQHWIAITLADEEAVEYPAVRADYFRTESFWSPGTDRFWLVGNGVEVDADEGVVVESNARFRLLDLERGVAVIAAPSQLNGWFPVVLPDGDTSTLGNAEVIVVRSPQAGADVVLTVRAGVDSPLQVRIESPGIPPAVGPAFFVRPSDILVSLPPSAAPVVLDIGAELPFGAQGANSIEMEGVRRGP
jgi:hypothetical protein